jgi:hypothetical protein
LEVKKRLPIELPKRALTNIDLKKHAKILKIHNFRLVFMKDFLSRLNVSANEYGIINLDDETGDGTHWTAYKKVGNGAVYFDSFGNLQPPLELTEYLNSRGSCKIVYNHQNLQSFRAVNCGHLSLKFLYNNNN